jgi:hypothetical protein
MLGPCAVEIKQHDNSLTPSLQLTDHRRCKMLFEVGIIWRLIGFKNLFVIASHCSMTMRACS